MTDPIRLACDSEILMVPLENILPTKMMSHGIRNSSKYKCIEASVRELGLIEPLVVYPQANLPGAYMLLDGHVRHLILKDLQQPTAKCLISTDDEGFTYNHKVSRLAVIQEHFMILKAIKQGVSEERIARALNIDVYSIRQKRDLLDGICAEAVQLLKDKRLTAKGFRELRKVKPMRQIEIAELLSAAHNYSLAYAQCLVAATSQDQMAMSDRPKEMHGLSPEDISRMEHEMGTLEREFKLIEDSHGKNVLNLVVVAGYLRKLLDNARIVRFLSQNHPELLAEFQKLMDAKLEPEAEEFPEKPAA